MSPNAAFDSNTSQGPTPLDGPVTKQPVSPKIPAPSQLPARRSRTPRGSKMTHLDSGSAMLGISARWPFYQKPVLSANLFIPDAQMLFHVLGECDQMMNMTVCFTQSCPHWIPIVSQLYISVLWLAMVITVYAKSGSGMFHSDLLRNLEETVQLGDCPIPGPLVPFFQALAAIDGPYEWVGNISPMLPSFRNLWNATDFHFYSQFARFIPCPAIILDQLHHFAIWQAAPDGNAYHHFLWYHNIFNKDYGDHNPLNRMGPQLCGSLYTSETQFMSAKTCWSAMMHRGIRRTDATEGNNQFTSIAQLFGFIDQDGETQTNWFSHISAAMQKYCQYFNDSVPFKSISHVGIGAVAVYGEPRLNKQTRNWLYPRSEAIAPFHANQYAALREIPDQLAVTFNHAYFVLKEQAELFATLTHTNIRWGLHIRTQNQWDDISDGETHKGTYWDYITHRESQPIKAKSQYAPMIASRFHLRAGR